MAEEPQATAPEGEDGAGGEAGAPAAPDFTPITDHLDQRLSEFGDTFQAQLDQRLAAMAEPAPQDGYGQPQDGYDQPDGYDAEALYGQDGEVDPRQAQQLLSQLIQAENQKALGPIMDQLNDLRLERGAERLEAQYPELQDQATAEALLKEAAQRAESIGQPELGANPAFLELVHKANRVDQLAASETPADGAQPSEMEGSGGAAPPVPEDDVGDRIVRAAGATPASAFWGARGV